MNDEKKVVDGQVEAAAPQQEVVDHEAIIAQKDAELAKVRQERENYRRGMLKAKGKLPEDPQSDTDDLEDPDERTRRIVQETMLSTKEVQLQAEKDATYAAVLKRNKELETALKNRGQITSTSGDGANQDKPEGKTDNYFSNDQIAALRAKGYDDAKIETLKKNMAKVNQMPK